MPKNKDRSKREKNILRMEIIRLEIKKLAICLSREIGFWERPSKREIKLRKKIKSLALENEKLRKMTCGSR